MVVDLHPVVAHEPRLPTGHRVHQVRLLAGEPHPGPAHHGGDLRPPQRLLVLVVQLEEGLRQLRVVVALLQLTQGVLQAVEGCLDLPGGAAHPGLRGRVDTGALRGELGTQSQQHAFQGDTQGRSRGVRVERARDRHVRVGELPGGGGYALRRQVLDLGRQRVQRGVESGAQGVRLGALAGQLAP
jgi:hypothetical protein